MRLTHWSQILIKGIFIFMLVVISGSTRLEAAQAPQAYVKAVQQLHSNSYGENDVKSFVYHIFAMYDYHVPVQQFYPHLVNTGLEMQFPEGKLQNHADFEHWYDVSVGTNIKNNTHTIEHLNVAVLGNKTYQVDLIVWWQAETMKGEYLSYRFHQVWTLVEDDHSLKIQKYVVRQVK